MRRELRDNIITFKFRKRNGDVRTAHGTLHPDYLPPLKGGGPRPEKQMVYYDLDKEGWRSFRSYAFIKILNIKPVTSKSVAIKPSKSATASASTDDEEEVKNNVPVENEEEQEVKKKVQTDEEEVEETPKHSKKKETDEDEEEHEYKSPIYDETKEEKEERKEDDEKIKDLKHKHEKEDEKESEDE